MIYAIDSHYYQRFLKKSSRKAGSNSFEHRRTEKVKEIGSNGDDGRSG